MGATDSKLAFRKGVFRLFEQRNIPIDEDEYWSQFWLLPESADDIFSLVAASDIRRVRDQARENLETLLLKVTTHLFHLLHHSQETIDSQYTTHMLNCIRILTRLLPFIWESEELAEWEDNFFWKSERKKEKEREEVEVIKEEIAGSATKNIKEEKRSFALGEKLVAGCFIAR